MRQVLIAGNPNCGKSTLFTRLTGIRQKTQNYPGATVEKKTATWKVNEELTVLLSDLPGMYSLYPHQQDEFASYKELTHTTTQADRDIIIVVADASNLKRNLLLLTQLKDMDLPLVLALTMNDIAEKKGIHIDIASLAKALNIPVLAINPLQDEGMETLGEVITTMITAPNVHYSHLLSDEEIYMICPAVKKIQAYFPQLTAYAVLHKMIYYSFHRDEIACDARKEIEEANKHISPPKVQSILIMLRYEYIQRIITEVQTQIHTLHTKKKFELDTILLHPIAGYVILLTILLGSFQMLFWVADYPMQLIDFLFFKGSDFFHSLLPNTWWSKLLIDGVWAGINGVVVFVPQIAFLFGVTAILEATGYMARINLLLDRWTKLVGLSGKSVMVFVNALACAVPAIMSARNIDNHKERLSTILVAPFITCSARLPVYVILISMFAPDIYLFGFIQLKAILLLSLYILGAMVAVLVAWVLQYIIPTKERSIFIQELPIYRLPYWKNILKEMYLKSKVFVTDAGRIIMVISLVIWFLSSYGFEHSTVLDHSFPEHTHNTTFTWIKPVDKIEVSYMGHLGKWIEPAVAPLGYNWEIGIALLTSFAAREVFIGTLSTIYSVSDDEEQTLIARMRSLTNSEGVAVYSTATLISLLLFYALAMQCMSTFAVVRKETNSLHIPLLQLLGMTVLAYAFARIGFLLFS